MIDFADQVRQNQLIAHFIFPWILMVVAGAWFGWLAHRRGRSTFLWAAGGALVGLLLTTIAEGLGHALAVPYSDAQRLANRVYAVGSAAVIIAIIGALIMWLLPPGAETRGGGTVR